MFLWYKYLIVNLVISHLGFWSENKNTTDPLRAVNIFNEKGDGPHRGFGYLSYRSGNMEQKRITVRCIFQQHSRYKDY